MGPERALSPWGSLSPATLEFRAKHTMNGADGHPGLQQRMSLPTFFYVAFYHPAIHPTLPSSRGPIHSSTHQPTHLPKPGLSTRTLPSASKARTPHPKQGLRLRPPSHGPSRISGGIVPTLPGHRPRSPSPRPPSRVLARKHRDRGRKRGAPWLRVSPNPAAGGAAQTHEALHAGLLSRLTLFHFFFYKIPP